MLNLQLFWRNIVKAIVKVKPNSHLLDITHNQVVTDERPCVVLMTYFIHQHIGFGTLKPLVGDLPDEASDVEFAKFWKDSDGNENLAIESYLSYLNGLVEHEQLTSDETLSQVEQFRAPDLNVEVKEDSKPEVKEDSKPEVVAKVK